VKNYGANDGDCDWTSTVKVDGLSLTQQNGAFEPIITSTQQQTKVNITLADPEHVGSYTITYKMAETLTSRTKTTSFSVVIDTYRCDPLVDFVFPANLQD